MEASLPMAIKNKNPETLLQGLISFCDPAGIRTQDPIIKSDVLYQLSYGILAVKKELLNCFFKAAANIVVGFVIAMPLLKKCLTI